MKKILVTGAAGFIGSHLCEGLVQKGYAVKAFVKYNSQIHYGWLEESSFKDDIEIVTGDIRDYDRVLDSLRDCEGVFHLAALIGIPYSYVSPLAYIRTNVEGTYNVLQAAKERSLGRVVITSTSETYGTAQYVPIDEKHPNVGQSPYSASKIAADQLAVSYHRSFGLPVQIVRPFNNYGPRQSARAIIPTIITQILDDQKELSLGNITPRRDFTYVKDTVDAFIQVFETRSFIGEAVNVGMREEISVGDLAKLIASLMGSSITVVQDSQRVRQANTEVERLCCDNTKLITNTGWAPRHDLRRGLEETIEWVKDNLSKYKARIYNV